MLQPVEAVEQIEPLLAHLWMVRTFLKHAEEIQDSLEMLEIPRTLFDVIRATEPAQTAENRCTLRHDRPCGCRASSLRGCRCGD